MALCKRMRGPVNVDFNTRLIRFSTLSGLTTNGHPICRSHKSALCDYWSVRRAPAIRGNVDCQHQSPVVRLEASCTM